MSHFVTITFDLNYASMSPHGTNVYTKIADALDELDYSKVVTGKKKREVQLPANTYVAEFETGVGSTDDIIEFVRDELKDIFYAYSVNGKYFISVGENWKWKIGRFTENP